MNNCAEIQPELGVYILGAVAPADRARVVSHLSSCERCRAEVADLAMLPALLAKVPEQTAARLAAGDAPPGERATVPAHGELIRRVARRRRQIRWLVAALTATAVAGWTVWLVVPVTAPGTMLRTSRIGSLTVLVNNSGFTVYWFSSDTSTSTDCVGGCARYWPPVTGQATAGPGVTGALGTITRPDGTIQATFDGHPLYTAALDTSPGQDRGNGLETSGGTWHAMVMSRA
jgi:predicted lipoprotein with Yx(FWY)xxD motif